MYEVLSTREIVAWIAGLVIAAGLIVLGAVYLNSDLTADALPVAESAVRVVPPAPARAENAVPAAQPAENAVPPAATMQLGGEDPKIASDADMPAQQQQFLSIISDFAQKYETAPNDMARNALRQQRARAICGIITDLTVTNWVATVKTLPGTDQGKGVLAVSLDKRSTIGTRDRKYNTLIKQRTAAAIQLSPGQTIVFSGRFFRAKRDCITERSPTLREAMTQPNWIVRFSAIMPAQTNVPPAAKSAEDAAPPAAKSAEDVASPAAKPAETGVPPAAERAEEAASPAAKPAEDAALPAARPTENVPAQPAENAVPPAATMQLGGEDPKIASDADMPAQQQQFLSIISDFAQKYETAPNDMARNALRQQRARAICGIITDLTVTNWVATVKTLPGTDQGKGVLAVSLDKRSTIGTRDRKYNTLIKQRTAAAIQLSPGQTIVFSGRFFRAKRDCITERSPTLREAMTQPNWIVRFSAIMPAQTNVPPAAKSAEDAAPPAAKSAEDAASPAAKPADDAASPAAKPAETGVPPAAERAEDAAPPAAKPADDAASPAAKPAENAVPPAAERAEEAASPAAKLAEDAAQPAAKPAAVPPAAERAEEAAPPAAKAAEDAALLARPTENVPAKPAENAVPPAAERAEDPLLPGATMQLGADLYEEDPKPAGKLYPGSVDWHVEQVASAAGEPPDLAAQADIEISELRLKVMLSIRHNRDAILPASPRLEIHFIVPSDFAHQGIDSIPGILMSGFIPLALSAVKVSDNSFELDLGRLGLDRNLQLLKERTWFYVPLVYNDGRRALLSVEKDSRGERAFRDAHIIPGER